MFNKYKFAVLTLERDFQIFKLELEYQNTNPCVFWIKLFLGSIFIVVSFIWWLHMYFNFTNLVYFSLWSKWMVIQLAISWIKYYLVWNRRMQDSWARQSLHSSHCTCCGALRRVIWSLESGFPSYSPYTSWSNLCVLYTNIESMKPGWTHFCSMSRSYS